MRGASLQKRWSCTALFGRGSVKGVYLHSSEIYAERYAEIYAEMYQWSLSHYWCQSGVAAAGILRPGAGRPGWERCERLPGGQNPA